MDSGSPREAWPVFFHLCRCWWKKLEFSQDSLKPWNDSMCLWVWAGLPLKSGLWLGHGSRVCGLGSVSLPSPATGEPTHRQSCPWVLYRGLCVRLPLSSKQGRWRSLSKSRRICEVDWRALLLFLLLLLACFELVTFFFLKILFLLLPPPFWINFSSWNISKMREE